MIKHLEGNIYGKLAVLEQSGSRKNQRIWKCQCECGNTTFVTAYNLVSGHSKSCGCMKGKAKKSGYKHISNGYVMIKMPTHPHSDHHGYVREHVIVAEEIFGRKLNHPEHVHHADGDEMNNTPSNLVICNDMAYHKLLHKRQRALSSCGNVNWLKCSYCKKYDAPENMYIRKDKTKAYHIKCENEDQSTRKKLRGLA